MRFLFLVGLYVLLSPISSAQTSGCRDYKANNYNPQAVNNDGSCKYPINNYSPTKLQKLPSEIKETSGLIYIDSLLWTHNDSGGDAVLYCLDPSTGNIIKRVVIANATNIDWEDITNDEEYIYIGDFGNNNGDRKNLRIFKIPIASLDNDTAYASKIDFSFSDQTDFTNNPLKTDYDAESIVSIDDKLYVFSKNWNNQQTRTYILDKNLTTQSVSPINQFNSNGMITGATFNNKDGVLVLCGYNAALQPFVWLLWDFSAENIWGGNKRRVNLQLPFYQMEGIAWKEESLYYLTNEELKKIVSIDAALFSLDVSKWIDSLNLGHIGVPTNEFEHKYLELNVFPNPASQNLNIKWSTSFDVQSIELFSIDGKSSEFWPISSGENYRSLDVSNYSAGQYFLVLRSEHNYQVKSIQIK